MDGLYVIHVSTNSRELEFLAQAKVKGLTAKDLSDYNFYKPHGRSSLLKIWRTYENVFTLSTAQVN